MQTAGTLRGNLRGNLWVPCTFRRGLIWKIRQKSGKIWAKSSENLSNFSQLCSQLQLSFLSETQDALLFSWRRCAVAHPCFTVLSYVRQLGTLVDREEDIISDFAMVAPVHLVRVDLLAFCMSSGASSPSGSNSGNSQYADSEGDAYSSSPAPNPDPLQPGPRQDKQAWRGPGHAAGASAPRRRIERVADPVRCVAV